jgi:soluble lytic murein transglycosylase-like protein
MRSVYALIPAALVAGTILGAPAEAKKADDPGIHAQRVSAQKKHFKIAGVKSSGKIRKAASLKTDKVAQTRKVASAKVTSAKIRKVASADVTSAKTRKVASADATSAKTRKVASADATSAKITRAKIASAKTTSAKLRKLASAEIPKTKVASAKIRKIAAFDTTTKTLRSGPRQIPMNMAGTQMNMSDQALAINGAGDTRVISIIREMAPSYGVPTWFALRIANVESGYNPYARGRAGEIGVYQLKCQTARGMGFSGDCSGLTDARTNVRWGLKHLSLAIASSGGDLRLAASKHNAGLGRKSLVFSYIAKVF